MSAEEIPYDIKKPITRSSRRVSDLYPQLLMKTSLSDPIKIGFSGSLTGSKSEIGVNGRNGALLAVEEINRQSGVTGRKGELVVAKERFQGLQQEIKMNRCGDAVGGYYLYRVQDGVFVKVGPI